MQTFLLSAVWSCPWMVQILQVAFNVLKTWRLLQLSVHLCRNTAGFSVWPLIICNIYTISDALSVTISSMPMTCKFIYILLLLDVALALIKEAISAVTRWLSDNSLILSASKTKATLLRNARFVNKAISNYINEPQLNFPIRLLTLMSLLQALSTSLSTSRIFPTGWTESCSNWSTVSLSIPLRVRLVSSLIFLFFDYYSAVFMDLTGQQRLKIRRWTHTCVLLYMLQLASISWDGCPRMTEENYLIDCLTYSILNTPSYLADGLRFCSRSRAISRISHFDLVVLNCRISAYQHSFAYATSSLWNSLPRMIKETDLLTSFRYALFCHLRYRVRIWQDRFFFFFFSFISFYFIFFHIIIFIIFFIIIVIIFFLLLLLLLLLLSSIPLFYFIVIIIIISIVITLPL